MFLSNIAKIAKEKRMTARAIIAATGLSPNTITKARRDGEIADCRLSTLGRIAHALEVPVKTLFDGEHEPNRREG
jgi:DNA-binding Xre family transcriptional regulator